MRKYRARRLAWLLAGSLLLAACGEQAPMRTVPALDLERFAGQWYVIAHVPVWLESDAHNAEERYELTSRGTVETTLTFNEGAGDGPLRTYRSTAVPDPEENHAVWAMQFIWPFTAEYRVIFVDPGYRTAVIGRSARDYAWIMVRSPRMDEADLRRLAALLGAEGYDLRQLRRVPHSSATPGGLAVE